MVVVANNINWPSLPSKIEAICDFYRPVCDINPIIVKTRLTPKFRLYPELAPLNVVDRKWYDENIAVPHALDADIILFITPASDHPGLLTYSGYMNLNNVGPWETTVFVNGEHDHVYQNGQDHGDYLTLIAEHELSHAFYAMVGKRDDTHSHFPNTPQGSPLRSDDPMPTHALEDFDFSSRYAVLEWLKNKLLAALTAIGAIQKKQKTVVLGRLEATHGRPCSASRSRHSGPERKGIDPFFVHRFRLPGCERSRDL